MRPLLFTQENHITRLTYPLAQAWRERGYDISSHMYNPDSRFWMKDEPSAFLDNMPIFVYGCVSFIEWASHHPVLSHWVWDQKDYFRPWNWVNHFGGRNTLNHPRMHLVNSLATLWDQIDGPGKSFHLRPYEVHKAFTGGVYTKEEFLALNLDGELQVALSIVRPIKAEFRVWIVGGAVVEVSQYRSFGRPMPIREGFYVEEARRVAEDLIAEHGTPLSHTVMDLALVEYDGVDDWKIVEFNPINSSGWYAADIGIVIDAFVEYYR